jgi:hypothetical protein
MPSSILDVDGLKASLMLLTFFYDSNPTCVAPTSHHYDIANIKFDEVNNLVGLQVQLDCVIGLDKWIWITDCAPIISVQVRDPLLTKLDRPHFAEFKLEEKAKKLTVRFYSDKLTPNRARNNITATHR